MQPACNHLLDQTQFLKRYHMFLNYFLLVVKNALSIDHNIIIFYFYSCKTIFYVYCSIGIREKLGSRRIGLDVWALDAWTLGLWMHGLDTWTLNAWTLGLWRYGIWTLGLWTRGRLDSRRLDSGCMGSGRLDAWTLYAWALDNWTLGFWTPGRLYFGRLDAWTLDDWTLGLWAIELHVRISNDNSYSIESISSNAANFRNSLLTLSVTS